MHPTDRRMFLKHTAGSLAAMAILPEFGLADVRLAEPLSVAVIGVGRQGRAIIGELQKIENVRIAALCDVEESRLAGGQRRAAGAAGYADYRALLDKHKDAAAVFIATPTHLHRDIAVAAAQAGRHVYCEAPLAHTAEDCAAIVRAARSSSKVFAAGLLARSNPIYRLARTFFRSDSVRDLVTMRAQSFQKTAWRTPVSDPAQERVVNWHLDPEVSLGLAGEWGTHQFDVIHWYVGRYPTSVRGAGDIRLHSDGRAMPDTIHCDLHFEKTSL